MATNNKKKVLLGISGSIAAYKAAYLTRLFIKAGAEVRVLMTPSACSFISPLTLSTLSKNEVYHEIINDQAWNNHVELGLWADIMVVAPATATTLSKMANGIADNILVACYLSAKCPVLFAPAMDLDMWNHPSTVRNINLLKSYGNTMIPVEHGELASGLIGDGRMADPETIVEWVDSALNNKNDLKGKRVMITAGPTCEAIDPVRFIGNHSSGKMGIALAEECVDRGADVTLILGPTKIQTSKKGVKTIPVTSAQEMYEASVAEYDKMHITILAAAVADYRPSNPSERKIKKTESDLSLALERTKDIAYELGKYKSSSQINVGFALETDDVITNAKKKMEKKNFDLIILNSLQDKGAGFKHDTNKITIFNKNGESTKFPLKLKNEVATDIVNAIVNIIT